MADLYRPTVLTSTFSALEQNQINRRVTVLTGEPVPTVPRDPTFDPDLANILRLLLAWTFPRNVSGSPASHGIRVELSSKRMRASAASILGTAVSSPDGRRSRRHIPVLEWELIKMCLDSAQNCRLPTYVSAVTVPRWFRRSKFINTW